MPFHQTAILAQEAVPDRQGRATNALRPLKCNTAGVGRNNAGSIVPVQQGKLFEAMLTAYTYNTCMPHREVIR